MCRERLASRTFFSRRAVYIPVRSDVCHLLDGIIARITGFVFKEYDEWI
jgi:hypothetical protein